MNKMYVIDLYSSQLAFNWLKNQNSLANSIFYGRNQITESAKQLISELLLE